MSLLAPPPPPTLAALGGRGPDRVRLRLMQFTWTTATVAATAWACTFGPLASILAICVAKHVLVAILVMGVGVDQTREYAESSESDD